MTRLAKTEGGLHVVLERVEADVLRGLLADMSSLLRTDAPRDDPVVARLFPRAYDDDADQRGYEALVAGELHQAKSSAVDTVRERLSTAGPVDTVVEASDIESWLMVLTDLRLAIGMRLDVTEEKMDSEIDAADPHADALSVLHWLGWVQQSIIEEITGE